MMHLAKEQLVGRDFTYFGDFQKLFRACWWAHQRLSASVEIGVRHDTLSSSYSVENHSSWAPNDGENNNQQQTGEIYYDEKRKWRAGKRRERETATLASSSSSFFVQQFFLIYVSPFSSSSSFFFISSTSIYEPFIVVVYRFSRCR